MLTEIRVPLRDHAGSAYAKVGRRVGDWAVVAAGAAVELADDETIARAGLALVAAGGDITASAAEAGLTGAAPSPELFARAGAIAAETCDPVSDQRGSKEYKRHVVGVLTERVLARATERARQQREK
jgi:carbon-monoxide dehydrogenase medium subunit